MRFLNKIIGNILEDNLYLHARAICKLSKRNDLVKLVVTTEKFVRYIETG